MARRLLTCVAWGICLRNLCPRLQASIPAALMQELPSNPQHGAGHIPEPIAAPELHKELSKLVSTYYMYLP